MGTVTEEIMSERPTDEVAVAEGELQLLVALFGLGRQQCGKVTERQTNKVDRLIGRQRARGG